MRWCLQTWRRLLWKAGNRESIQKTLVVRVRKFSTKNFLKTQRQSRFVPPQTSVFCMLVQDTTLNNDLLTKCQEYANILPSARRIVR